MTRANVLKKLGAEDELQEQEQSWCEHVQNFGSSPVARPTYVKKQMREEGG
jgi:hypothetical protein